MNLSSTTKRLIVGISGASGIVYGIEALRQLRQLGVETHLVVSKSAILTLSHESEMKYAELCKLADRHYQSSDIGAAISSGSFRTMGMLVAPCSIRSLAEIATGVTSSLLSRAADGPPEVCTRAWREEQRRRIAAVHAQVYAAVVAGERVDAVTEERV